LPFAFCPLPAPHFTYAVVARNLCLCFFQETFAFASKAKGHKGTRAQGQQGPLCVFLFKFKFKTKNKNEIITMTMEAKAVPQK